MENIPKMFRIGHIVAPTSAVQGIYSVESVSTGQIFKAIQCSLIEAIVDFQEHFLYFNPLKSSFMYKNVPLIPQPFAFFKKR